MGAKEVVQQIEEALEETRRLVQGNGTEFCVEKAFETTRKKLSQLKEIVGDED